MQIVRWQPYMNHHQYFLWSEVEHATDESILFVLNIDLINARKKQGWQPFEIEEKKYVYLESIFHGMQIIRDTPDSIHAFQSFFGPKLYFILILYALLKGVKVVVTAEPYSIYPLGYFREELKFIAKFKTIFRPVIYKIIAKIINLEFFKYKICILAISDIAQKQFIRNGFSPDIVFPFGYFIPSSSYVRKTGAEKDKLRIIFMGSLLKIKGVDLLIDAIATLEKYRISVSLDLFGAGNIDVFLNNRDLSFVKYEGVIPPAKAQHLISEYDVLVLPSRHDGWGVVVNEAILQRVPVVVSDQAGASCLVRASGAGLVFNSDNLDSLINALRILALDPMELQKVKQNAANFDISKIAPDYGAKYFVQVMEYFFWEIGEKPFLFWDEKDQYDKSNETCF